MFESIEIRKVEIGIIVTMKSYVDDDKDYVFPSLAKAIKFVKEFLESKPEK